MPPSIISLLLWQLILPLEKVSLGFMRIAVVNLTSHDIGKDFTVIRYQAGI